MGFNAPILKALPVWDSTSDGTADKAALAAAILRIFLR
jgi:hypothetical protein